MHSNDNLALAILEFGREIDCDDLDKLVAVLSRLKELGVLYGLPSRTGDTSYVQLFSPVQILSGSLPVYFLRDRDNNSDKIDILFDICETVKNTDYPITSAIFTIIQR